MVKFNKFILISLFLVLISVSAVSAADGINSTGDFIVQSTSNVGDDLKVDEDVLQANSEEILKEESNSVVITNETFSTYFDSEGRLLDSVDEGSTLDFQGLFEVSDNIKGIYINKSVNITSSSNDATFMFNSVNGESGMENITGRFVVDGTSSINIDNVVFNRTQILIYDSSSVVLNNIKIISDGYNMYSQGYPVSEGILKIYNVECVSIKNSYFYAHATISGIIECSGIKDISIDNNTFYSFCTKQGIATSVGNEVNLKTIANNASMTNNILYTNCTTSAFVVLLAKEILFENNSHVDVNILNRGYYGKWVHLGQSDSQYHVIVKNNNLIDLRAGGNAILMNNTVHRLRTYLSYSTMMYNSTVSIAEIKSPNVLIKDSKINLISIGENNRNITFENNIIIGSVSIQSPEVFFNNNSITGDIKIEDTCEMTNNRIYGQITMSSKVSTIRENTIYSPLSDYAIVIKSNKNYVLNEISNNKIYSKLYCGDNAVSYDKNFFNTIEYNTPKTQLGIFVNTTINTFDYGESTTIVVNIADVNGDVTIDVDGQKYIVKLVNGRASQVLTKYALGINNVSVIYEDLVNDVWAINHTNFTVNKVICPIKLVYNNVSEGEVSSVNFILPDDANGTILITLTNGVLTANIMQDAKGTNNIIYLPGLSEGEYAINATFKSIKYFTNSTLANICFVHIPIYKLIASSVVMDYKDGSKYKVLVTKDGKHVGAGEVVKITFNGVTKNVKTDKNGYATLTLDAAPKTYAIKAICNGVTKSNKVTIKNILKASNISKKKAKKIKFSANLKNSKGKAIVGKKITFKFKGKNYSAKTNKKGVATITLKNLNVGKYTIASKYGACAVKNTIKINK